MILPPNHPEEDFTPTPPAALSPAQAASVASLVAHFSSPDFTLAVPSELPALEHCAPIAYPASGALIEAEEMWLTEECLCRFLRATKWDEAAARHRIVATLTWRRDFQVDAFTAEYLSPENETGKQVLFGYTRAGQPTYYMRPALQNTDTVERQIQQTIYMLCLCEALMPRGVEKLALMINFAARGASPAISTAKRVLYILQDHYPERLATAFVINLPFIIRGFFRVISPLLDPVTRAKLNLPSTADCTPLVPPSQLENAFGGNVDFGTYGPEDHARYWLGSEGICALARERNRRSLEAWRKLEGNRIGRKEWDFKASEETWGVGASATTPSADENFTQQEALEQKPVAAEVVA